jgi:hypothetical protein
MTHTKPPDGQTTAQRLKKELDRLKRAQIEALQAARFGGMTAAEMKAYDERHGRIQELVQRLELDDDETLSAPRTNDAPPFEG